MAKLSNRQCRSLVFRYFLNEGWLPAGTTKTNWGGVQISDLAIDDPPLPADPNFQKKRVAMDLRHFFSILGSGLSSPLEQLKRPTKTLHALADWCFENQTGG